jgi:hypothetical protein
MLGNADNNVNDTVRSVVFPLSVRLVGAAVCAEQRRGAPDSPGRGAGALIGGQARRRLVGSDRRPGGRQLFARRLEELDRVAGGVLEEDLPAVRPANDVVAEREPGRAQPLHLCRDVVGLS